jgi:tRNA(Ile)-lysidine synthase
MGVKPNAGVQAAARGARHRLLANAARSLGASVVLFAHTLDDVVEGDWMRQKDAPSLGRLRPWSPSPVWPEGREIFILRPLLDLRRAQLRAWLLDRGATWVEDPANDDPRFARARARAALTADPPAPRLPAPSAAQASAPRFKADDEGAFRFDRIDWPEDLALARRLLSAAVACASGSPSPPPSAGLTRLVALCQTQETFVATLAGARILAERSCLTISREAGEFIRRPAKAAFLRAGATTVWDGRFEIKATSDLELTPLNGRAARLSRSDRARLAAVDPERRQSLPALTIDGAVCLPQPWGDGPAAASQLCGRRFIAACGLLAHEREISQSHMAEGRQSSYVEVQALA